MVFPYPFFWGSWGGRCSSVLEVTVQDRLVSGGTPPTKLGQTGCSHAVLSREDGRSEGTNPLFWRGWSIPPTWSKHQCGQPAFPRLVGHDSTSPTWLKIEHALLRLEGLIFSHFVSFLNLKQGWLTLRFESWSALHRILNSFGATLFFLRLISTPIYFGSADVLFSNSTPGDKNKPDFHCSKDRKMRTLSQPFIFYLNHVFGTWELRHQDTPWFQVGPYPCHLSLLSL
jgi:hypothetical protein